LQRASAAVGARVANAIVAVAASVNINFFMSRLLRAAAGPPPGKIGAADQRNRTKPVEIFCRKLDDKSFHHK
jgi:hypothetical protein